MNLTSFYKLNKFLIFTLFLSIVSIFTWHCIVGKHNAFIAINDNYSSFGDFAFPIITMLGEVYLIIPMILYLLLRNIKLGMGLLIAYGLSALSVQFIKYGLGIDNIRPITYFYTNKWYTVHTISNYINNNYYSFPSGHTATAFSIFCYVAFTVENNAQKIFCFTIAAFIGYSRIYLAQHFVSDVLAGACIGIFFAILAYLYFYKNEKISSAFLHKSII